MAYKRIRADALRVVTVVTCRISEQQAVRAHAFHSRSDLAVSAGAAPHVGCGFVTLNRESKGEVANPEQVFTEFVIHQCSIGEQLHALALLKQSTGSITPEAPACFEHALQLAEPEGYILLFVEEGPAVATLLRAAAHHTAAPERLRQYAHKLLATLPGRDQPAPMSAAAVGSVPACADLIEPLTRRELEVLRLVCEGCSKQEIAERLVITVSAVKKHAGNIFGKLNVSSRTQAIACARQLGLLSLDGYGGVHLSAPVSAPVR